MKSIAIITARGGSKRIPKKNIKDFCGKPIIAYSIEAALKSELFEHVMVSTDSEEIASIAKEYGAEVPFMRSAATSNDYADTTDVLLEVIDEYERRGEAFETFCCIYPTAPFVTADKLKKSFEMLMEEDTNNVVPMVLFSFPPQRAMVENGKFIEAAYPQFIEFRSQDLQEMLHDCGQFYWCKTAAFKLNSDFLTNNTRAYMLSEIEVQDIDNESDWEIAEIKYQYLLKRGIIQ